MTMSDTATLSAKFQISIPKAVLQRLARPGIQLTVTNVDGTVRLS